MLEELEKRAREARKGMGQTRIRCRSGSGRSRNNEIIVTEGVALRLPMLLAL